MTKRDNPFFSIIFSVVNSFNDGIFKNLRGLHKVNAVFFEVVFPLVFMPFNIHTRLCLQLYPQSRILSKNVGILLIPQCEVLIVLVPERGNHRSFQNTSLRVAGMKGCSRCRRRCSTSSWKSTTCRTRTGVSR